MPCTGFEHAPAFDVREVTKHQGAAHQINPEVDHKARTVHRHQKPIPVGAKFEPSVAKRNRQGGIATERWKIRHQSAASTGDGLVCSTKPSASGGVQGTAFAMARRQTTM